MNSLYSVEQDKNRWDYGGDVGIISKQTVGSDYDAEQDIKIESNKEQIQETQQSLRENNARDDAQQHQLDANDALDATQQTQINSNTEAIQRNESRDDSQQLQINETIELLNKNIADDEKQQAAINNNTTEIIRLQGEMPKLSIEGTTMIIGQKKDE